MQHPTEQLDDLYLGRLLDANNRPTDKPYMYKTDDLTTHALVVGMTGSGKTGLCLSLLEEAAIDGLPAILIDPKGDITNLLLQFPALRPQDFEPWINPDTARRQNQTLTEAATATADQWRTNLAEWGITSQRIQGLLDSANFRVYTPGSEAGLPISIMTSLAAPPDDWSVNREVLREQIAATVTALLGIVGFNDLDPVTSREHILLSNLFEDAWSKHEDLDLGKLILRIQNPPFTNLGVFDVDQFYPKRDRFTLAMRLNNILAAPSFQSWVTGDPLDIQSLLYTEDGRPRHSVFYLAHLAESERMFIVTLLLSSLESWMRRQSGTTSLRALLYFDELYGYMPPVRNTPAKPLLIRLLKQARAFGIGLLLATQNPGDVDYKGLSNAGTWFVGRLQTEVDKNRLLDGLMGAVAEAGTSLDRPQTDKLISALPRRTFLVKNIHRGNPDVFATRQVMCYLAGPMRREQIRDLNALHGVYYPNDGTGAGGTAPALQSPAPLTPAEVEAEARNNAIAPVNAAVVLTPRSTSSNPRGGNALQPASPVAGYTTVRRVPPLKMQEFFLPRMTSLAAALVTVNRAIDDQTIHVVGCGYKPGLLAQARVRFTNRTNTINEERAYTAFITETRGFGTLEWQRYTINPIPANVLLPKPEADLIFADFQLTLPSGRTLRNLQDEFIDSIFHNLRLDWHVNERLGLEAASGESLEEFRWRCQQAANQQEDVESQRLADRFRRQMAAIETRLDRENRKLSDNEAQLRARQLEEATRYGEMLLNLFSRRRHGMDLTSSMAVRRRKQKTETDIKTGRSTIESFKDQLDQLDDELAAELQALELKWRTIANETTVTSLAPLKRNIAMDLFGVLWWPHWLVDVGGRVFQLPAYTAGEI